MKKVIYNLLLTLMMFSFTSCLTSGLDELDVYDGADITSVSAVAYRYISDEKSPASGQNIVKEVNLTFTSDIDTDAATVKITVSVPENFRNVSSAKKIRIVSPGFKHSVPSVFFPFKVIFFLRSIL